jgi:hypothetical protein
VKLYLDDVRPAPDSSWNLVSTAEEAIEWLQDHPETHTVSLDHDLGVDEDGNALSSGYDVLCWMEDRLYSGKKIPKNNLIHTNNSAGSIRMEQALYAINNYRGTFR